MILQALKDYYDRKAADPESGIAPLGWEKKPIPFLVVIDGEGAFVKLVDTRCQDGKKKIGKSFVVPSLGEAKGNGIKANLFWENAEYFFGIKVKQDGKGDRSKEQHRKFKDEIYKLSTAGNSIPAYVAVASFLQTFDTAQIMSDSLWGEVLKEKGANFVFSVGGMVPVTDLPEIRKLIDEARRKKLSDAACSRCLVTGEEDVIAKLEPTICGFAATGAHLVAVNNKVTGSGNGGATPAFASFNKEQGENSPIGKRASHAYTTALNTLLARDSRQKIHVGDATVVFWADRDTSFEDEMASIFDDSDRKDDPDALTGAVSQLLTSVKNGGYHEDCDPTRFFVLGLAPNSARISVRFWHQGTVEEMSGRFASWFEGMMIIHRKEFKDHLSMYRLLCSIAPLGKSENIPPNLAGDVMRSILEGTTLPETLLQGALRRERAEHRASGKEWEFDSHEYARMKLIKACLNRKYRNSNSTEKEITIMLDKENTNIGYRLGRLFATLERIQEKSADTKLNSTIRDKYYAAASSTPATVFGTLMRLAGNHLAKLSKKNPGWKVLFEKLLGEITYKTSDSVGIAQFPAHLKLDDQGQFAIGYYHQRQDFFTKKDDVETTSDK